MRTYKSLLVVIFALSLLFTEAAWAAKPLTWTGFLLRNRNKPISIYVENFTNSTGNRDIDAADLKKRIENAFATRMSYTFTIAKDEKDAKIVLKGAVTEYYWTESDPIDHVYGVGAIAMDMVKQDHYVRMQADLSMFLAETGHRLWTRDLQATVTHPTMTEQESYDMVNERMVEVLTRNLFKKPRTARDKYSTIN